MPKHPLANYFSRSKEQTASSLTSSVRFRELDDGYSLALDLPGVPRERLTLNLSEHRLFLKFSDSEGSQSSFVPEFEHDWRLPTDSEESSLSAVLANGVLTISVAKVTADSAIKSIEIL